MQPGICFKCSPQLAHLREHAEYGIKQLMDAAKSMKHECDVLPDDLKPYGEALTEFTMRVLAETFIESLTRYSARCFREITPASGYEVPSVKKYRESVSTSDEAVPRNHQIEKEE